MWVKTLSIYRKLFLFLVPTFILAVVGTPVVQASNPLSVKLLTPSVNMKITPGVPITLTFEFTGDGALSQTECLTYIRENLNIAVLRTDSANRAEFWASNAYGGGLKTRNLEAAFYQFKATSNGFTCSTRIEDKGWGDWYLSNLIKGTSLDTEDINSMIPNTFSEGKPSEINQYKVYWRARGDKNPPNVSTFAAVANALPVVKILGISRGETIKYWKPFQVQVEYSPQIKIGELTASLDSRRLTCGDQIEILKTSERIQIQKTCLVFAERDYPSRSLRASVDTNAGRTYSSEEVLLNMGDIGNLISYAKVTPDWGKNSKVGGKTTIEIKIDGELYIEDSRGVGGRSLQSIPVPGVALNICISGNCTKVITDTNGNYTFIRELKGTDAVVSIEGFYNGFSIHINGVSLNRKAVSKTFTVDEMQAPAKAIPPGIPAGKVNKKSNAYKFLYNVGKNVAKVSEVGDTATRQCNLLKTKNTYRYFGTEIYGLNPQLRGFLLTASGYQGCIDGFGTNK